MATLTQGLTTPDSEHKYSLKTQLTEVSNELLSSFPAPEKLSPVEQRGIIARYSSVLEGNFIYWMTGAWIAAKTEEAQATIKDNLFEEVRDSHPAMLRKFFMAANASPNESDVLDVHANLTKVRLFIGKLSPTHIIAMMAFFEDFIQKFMPYLADLAKRRGSNEMEYTDVHGVCDVAHSEGLFHALEAELAVSAESDKNLFEGVDILKTLIQNIVFNHEFAKAQ